MSKSIFNTYIVRKYLEIFRRKAPIGRESHFLHSTINAGNRRRFTCTNYLTSPHLHSIDSTTTATSRGYIINQDHPSSPPPQTPIPAQPPEPTPTMPILPSHRLLARAFYRKPTSLQTRNITSTTSRAAKTDGKSNSSNWRGRKSDEHVVRTDDTHNVQKESSEAGLKERASKGEQSGSSAISERDEKGAGERAKKENPEAPGPILGMNDERGGKGQ